MGRRQTVTRKRIQGETWRRCRLCLTGAGLALAGIFLALSGWPDLGARAHYRPGGVALNRLESALTGADSRVDGCLSVRAAPGAPGPAPGLARMVDILSRSATARAVLRQAGRRNVHVCLDEHTDLLGYYFAGMGVIGVSTELDEGAKVAFLAHELGHVLQHPTYADNRYFPPRDLVLLRRIREAAAEALATQIAWELREAGYPAAWDEKIATPYGDISRAFARAVGQDGASPGLRHAARAAFDRWFAEDWRLDVYDRMTLDHLSRISKDARGLVPARLSLHDGFLRGIGVLDGGNFLAPATGRPLTDAYYAGRLSAAHAVRLRDILRRAREVARTDDSGPMIGAAS